MTKKFKRFIAGLSAAALCLTPLLEFPVGTFDFNWNMNASAEGETENGEQTQSGVPSFDDNGTPDDLTDDTYLIGTAEELIWFAEYVNSNTLLKEGATVYYNIYSNVVNAKLTADIDFTEKTFVPIGVSDLSIEVYGYSGNFDGQGYTVSGIDYSVTNTTSEGSCLDKDAYAGFFAETYNAVISNLTVKGSFEGISLNCDAVVGGIVGYDFGNTQLTNCGFIGEITGSAKLQLQLGGLVGHFEGTATNCYSSAKVTLGTHSIDFSGAFVGVNNRGTFENCYYNSEICDLDECEEGDLANVDGVSAAEFCEKLGKHSCGEATCTAAAVCEICGTACEYVKEHTFVDSVCTDCGIDDNDTPDNTSDDYYPISTAEELIWFAEYVNSNTLLKKDGYYNQDVFIDKSTYSNVVNAKLTADIDFTGKTFVPIGERLSSGSNIITFGYSGNFDGQGHTVSGINYTVSSDSDNVMAGFFVETKNAVISNLTVKGSFEGISPNYDAYVGGIVSYDNYNTKLTNCGFIGEITGSAKLQLQLGGLVGNFSGKATNCYSSATVTLGEHDIDYSGAFVGVNFGTFENCYYNSEICTLDEYEEGDLAGVEGKTSEEFSNGTVCELLGGHIPAICEVEIIEINATNFPDENFRTYVSDDFDVNDDGVLDCDEIRAVTEINVDSMEISSLKGIEYFTQLKYLYCNDNSINAINLSQNKELVIVHCLNCNLEAIDLSGLENLEGLNCMANKLTSIDLSDCIALREFRCADNNLTELDLSNNINLENLSVPSNKLTSLDVTALTKLSVLNCDDNNITELDLSLNTELNTLQCQQNALTFLDLSGLEKLETVSARNNKITVDFTNGTYPISSLPSGFNTSNVLSMENGAIVENSVIAIENPALPVTYMYDTGFGDPVEFTIQPSSCDFSNITIMPIDDVEYTGKEIKPEITVMCGDVELTKDVDYEIGSYINNIEAGEATVIIYAIGDFYTGSAEATFNIVPLDLSADDFTFTAPENLVFDGKFKLAELEYNGEINIDGFNTTVIYYNESGEEVPSCKNAGVYTVGVRVYDDDGNIVDEIITDESWTFEISKRNLTADDLLFISPENLVFDGESKSADLEYIGKIDGISLDTYIIYYNESGEDVGVPVDAGVYTVGVRVYDDYGNIVEEIITDESWTFEILPLDISDAEIEPMGRFIYNGSERLAPDFGISVGEIILVENDYTVSGELTATDAGEHTVTITGVGNFTGKITGVWEIEKNDLASYDLSEIFPENAVYDGTAKEASVSLVEPYTGMGDVTYKYVEYYSDTEVETPVNAGEYKVYVDISEGKNFNAVTDLYIGSFTIEKAYPTVNPVIPDKVYTDGEEAPEITTSENDTKGVIAWMSGVIKLVEGMNTLEWEFTPENVNYEVVTGTVTINAVTTTVVTTVTTTATQTTTEEATTTTIPVTTTVTATTTKEVTITTIPVTTTVTATTTKEVTTTTIPVTTTVTATTTKEVTTTTIPVTTTVTATTTEEATTITIPVTTTVTATTTEEATTTTIPVTTTVTATTTEEATTTTIPVTTTVTAITTEEATTTTIPVTTTVTVTTTEEVTTITVPVTTTVTATTTEEVTTTTIPVTTTVTATTTEEATTTTIPVTTTVTETTTEEATTTTIPVTTTVTETTTSSVTTLITITLATSTTSITHNCPPVTTTKPTTTAPVTEPTNVTTTIITVTTTTNTTTTSTPKLTVIITFTTTPVTTTTPTTTTPDNVLIGDISRNGKIDLYDAIEICRYIMGMRELNDEEFILADYNCDKVVDLYDAIGIAKALLPKKAD